MSYWQADFPADDVEVLPVGDAAALVGNVSRRWIFRQGTYFTVGSYGRCGSTAQ